jgi:hypothetical protein
MPNYDMYCPNCNEDRGESLFSSLAEYDDLSKRPRCDKCESPLERKAVQAFNIGKQEKAATRETRTFYGEDGTEYLGPFPALVAREKCGCEKAHVFTPKGIIIANKSCKQKARLERRNRAAMNLSSN